MDGGNTWSDPIHIQDLEDGPGDYPGCTDPSVGYCHLTGLAIRQPTYGNLVASPMDGTLYFVFSDNRNGRHDVQKPITNLDVFVMSSTDGGANWTGPDPVSEAVSDQGYPFAAVDSATGELGVVFYDRSYHPRDRVFDVTLATGRPRSFSSRRVTTESMPLTGNLWVGGEVPDCRDACVTFIGDYIGMAFGGDGTADIVWADARRFVHVPDVGAGFTENIFFAHGG